MLRKNMKKYEIIILLAFMLASCKTQKVEVVDTHIKVDTVRVVQTQRDSINVHDSIFVDRWREGDTVFVVKERWKTEYSDRVKTDTLIQVRDSIVYHDREVVEEKKPPIGWTYIKGIFIGACGALVFAFLYGITKNK